LNPIDAAAVVRLCWSRAKQFASEILSVILSFLLLRCCVSASRFQTLGQSFICCAPRIAVLVQFVEFSQVCHRGDLQEIEIMFADFRKTADVLTESGAPPIVLADTQLWSSK